MPKPRVILHPGEVRSINDNQVHYIPGFRLKQLYGLRPDDNVVVMTRDTVALGFRPHRDDIHLGPRMFADQYKRPEELDAV